jgi:hypothetical protein
VKFVGAVVAPAICQLRTIVDTVPPCAPLPDGGVADTEKSNDDAGAVMVKPNVVSLVKPPPTPCTVMP